jgi:hypothetical protein
MSEHFQYLKEGLVADLVSRVMEDYHLDMKKALDVVYSSVLFEKLSDPDTGLYKEGPAYVYSFLKDELALGRL